MEQESKAFHVLISPLAAQGPVNTILNQAELLSLASLNTYYNLNRLVIYTNILSCFTCFPTFQSKTIPGPSSLLAYSHYFYIIHFKCMCMHEQQGLGTYHFSHLNYTMIICQLLIRFQLFQVYVVDSCEKLTHKQNVDVDVRSGMPLEHPQQQS